MHPPIRAASLRFTHLDRARWPAAVRALVALGFDAIDLPLVWGDYAHDDGSPDTARLDHDVRALLAVVRDAGARAVLRVGPSPVPDLHRLGLPDAILNDAAARSHTRRRNPRWTTDGLRMVPVPSMRSERYVEAASAWVRAACAHAGDDGVARVIVGCGDPTVLRDAPQDPDCVGLDAATADLAESEASALATFLERLATETGVDASRVVLTIPGDPLANGAAAALAPRWALGWAALHARAGVRAIWRGARLATTLPAGHHVDLRAGHAPLEAPSRATDALEVARIALAAGVRDFTLLHGCAGAGWVGAVLDDQGIARSPAARWEALLGWAHELPDGRDVHVAVPHDRAAILRARSEAVLGALPISWLSRWGFDLDDVTAAPTGALAAEDAAVAHGAPWAPVLGDAGANETTTLTAHIDPPGAALVRVVEGGGARSWVLANTGVASVNVTVGDQGRTLDAGAVAVLHEETGDA